MFKRIFISSIATVALTTSYVNSSEVTQEKDETQLVHCGCENPECTCPATEELLAGCPCEKDKGQDLASIIDEEEQNLLASETEKEENLFANTSEKEEQNLLASETEKEENLFANTSEKEEQNLVCGGTEDDEDENILASCGCPGGCFTPIKSSAEETKKLS